MKPDVVSGLVNAAWPALLVDAAGTVIHSNQAAVGAFGASLTAGATLQASIWLAENGASPAEFFSHWERQPSAVVQLKLLGAGGVHVTQSACICSVHEDGQKFFLLQFPGQGFGGEAKGASVDAGLAHKQKLDCALQLARTVSLDFNNALTSIMGHTSLILGKMEANNPLRKSLLEVEKSAERAAEIANDLAAFSRNEKETKAQTAGNLNLLLQRNVETFQAARLDKEVKWVLELERKLFGAKFDEAKMQQALVKIMENAVESLPEHHGRIILQTKNLDLTEPATDRNVQLAAGSYVCAEITDTGCGIEADVLPRIFEPFFTTKRGPKHRGLGLAWVYGIVTNHGGGVAVSSQPGTGTSVRVYLPADKSVVNDHGPIDTDLKGTQTILMVDDEDLLLTMGQTILSEFGYRVLTANNGAKALEILSKSDRQIDLIITDLVMPKMSGRELAEQVARVSPATRVLCSSGYVRPNSDEQGRSVFLQKPFTSRDLLMKVKLALTPDEAASVD